ncbi:7294_t:CDS:2 [Funneliformis geosporum]|uniref:7294_t:CDS:1 n=1 Tax=Funneliformis geosporum TaxID=1117311 RepID=A0A9W4X2B3_9GLOM|nr:7294_t:CDS:2 [Funneliformis geosporum]
MSATRVVNVTTTIKKEIKPLEEEKVEATTHLYSTKLSRTTSSRSTYEVKHHDDYLLEQWQRHGTEVALKRLHNSQFITMEFLNQVCHLQSLNI